MTYSLDLRERVIDYVQQGNSLADASRVFTLSRRTIYNWLGREDLAPAPCGPRKRKIDKVLLAQHVRDFPLMILRERAGHFGVSISSMWYALKKLGITKKND